VTAAQKNILHRAVPIAFYVLLIVFLVLYVRRIDFDALKDIRIHWPPLAIAGGFGLVFRFWGALIWLVLLKSLGANNLRGSRRQLVQVYARSWMGRYIPGTAPWILGKIYFASQHGVSKNKLAVSALLEGALQMVVLMAMSFVMLVSDSRLHGIDRGTQWLVVAVLVACVVTLVPSVFNGLVSTVHRILRKKPLDASHLASGKTIVTGALMYAVGAVLSGLSFYFVTRSVWPALGAGDALFVMGAGNFSGAISMLAICAPSGLGVREGVLLVLLGMIIPPEAALAATVLSRLWGIVMDLVFFGVGSLVGIWRWDEGEVK
jgi:hypothetical protein